MVVFIRDLDINNDDDLDDFGTSASASADAYTVNPRVFPSLASALSHAVTDYQSPTPPTTPGPVVARLRAHPHVRPIFMSRTTSMSTTQPGGVFRLSHLRVWWRGFGWWLSIGVLTTLH